MVTLGEQEQTEPEQFCSNSQSLEMITGFTEESGCCITAGQSDMKTVCV